MKKNLIGKSFKLTEDFTTFVKEGHEIGGFSKAATISENNTFTIVGERPNNWFEGQIRWTERYAPPYGGDVIRWKGIILVHGDQLKKFKVIA